jgi:hypothetical protein
MRFYLLRNLMAISLNSSSRSWRSCSCFSWRILSARLSALSRGGKMNTLNNCYTWDYFSWTGIMVQNISQSPHFKITILYFQSYWDYDFMCRLEIPNILEKHLYHFHLQIQNVSHTKPADAGTKYSLLLSPDDGSNFFPLECQTISEQHSITTQNTLFIVSTMRASNSTHWYSFTKKKANTNKAYCALTLSV